MMTRIFFKKQSIMLSIWMAATILSTQPHAWGETMTDQSVPNPDFFNMDLMETLSTSDGNQREPLKYNIKLEKSDSPSISGTHPEEHNKNVQYQIKLENPSAPQDTPPPVPTIPTQESSSPPIVSNQEQSPSSLQPTSTVEKPSSATEEHHQTAPTSIMTDEKVELYPRDSHLIILPEDPIQIFLADPKVAEIQQTNATTLHVQGLSPGNTEIVVTGKKSRNLYRYRVKVLPDYRELQDFVTRNYQNNKIEIKSVPNGVLIEGNVPSSKDADKIKTLAERFFPEKGAVISHLQIKTNTQINLQVKIVEVNRTVVNQLGINWDTVSHYGNLRFGMLNGRLPIDLVRNGFTSPSALTEPIKSIGARFHDGHNDIKSLLDMLAQEQLATVLAEPNLITSSGEEASFLAGGEFPYPVAQGIGTTQTVSFQFKKYGISLAFLPVVMGDSITLRVRPEVSDLDDSRTIRDQNGNNIPSIRTRRAESTIELGNGQSMVMAGLLSDQTSSNINAYPGLADVPVLGALFRSNKFKSDKTELVIVVTPYFVEPMDSVTEVSLPTDGLKYTNFFDMVWRRRLNEPRQGEQDKPLSTITGQTGFYH